jgi:hypothetical protein
MGGLIACLRRSLSGPMAVRSRHDSVGVRVLTTGTPSHGPRPTRRATTVYLTRQKPCQQHCRGCLRQDSQGTARSAPRRGASEWAAEERERTVRGRKEPLRLEAPKTRASTGLLSRRASTMHRHHGELRRVPGGAPRGMKVVRRFGVPLASVQETTIRGLTVETVDENERFCRTLGSRCEEDRAWR